MRRLRLVRLGIPVSPFHPMEALLLGASALEGFVALTGLASPKSIAETLPASERVIWSVLLLAGGVLGLVGRQWLGVYRIGLAFTAAGAVTYAAALFTTGRIGVVSGIIFLGWALACATQIILVTHRLELIRRKVVRE